MAEKDYQLEHGILLLPWELSDERIKQILGFEAFDQIFMVSDSRELVPALLERCRLILVFLAEELGTDRFEPIMISAYHPETQKFFEARGIAATNLPYSHYVTCINLPSLPEREVA